MLDAQMIMNMFWIAIAMMNSLDELSENQATTLNGYAELLEMAINKLVEANGQLRNDLHGTALDNDKLGRENVRLESELRMKDAILANVQKANGILHSNIAQLVEPAMREWFKENPTKLLANDKVNVHAITYCRKVSGLGLDDAIKHVKMLTEKLNTEAVTQDESYLGNDVQAKLRDDIGPLHA